MSYACVRVCGFYFSALYLLVPYADFYTLEILFLLLIIIYVGSISHQENICEEICCKKKKVM